MSGKRRESESNGWRDLDGLGEVVAVSDGSQHRLTLRAWNHQESCYPFPERSPASTHTTHLSSTIYSRPNYRCPHLLMEVFLTVFISEANTLVLPAQL